MAMLDTPLPKITDKPNLTLNNQPYVTNLAYPDESFQRWPSLSVDQIILLLPSIYFYLINLIT